MIAEIRNHIDTCVKSISKKYQTDDQNPFFKDEEVVGTRVDHFYTILFGSTVTEEELSGENTSNITVTLKTYVQGSRNKLADFDEGYCHAIMINCLVVDRSRYIGSQYIKNIESSQVSPIEVLDAQDIYAFESTFNIKLSYGLGD